MKDEPKVMIYDRCPSWQPGNLLKCVGVRGHIGLCHAFNPHEDKEKMTWEYRILPETQNQVQSGSEPKQGV
jgi:hypothetical protein